MDGRTRGAAARHAEAREPQTRRSDGEHGQRAGTRQALRREPHVPAAACPIADACGACSRISQPYAEQLAWKEAQVRALFSPLVESDAAFEPIAGMASPWRFRDKIASPFAPGRAPRGKGGRGKAGAGREAPAVLCGMFAAGSHRIVPIERCPVENEAGRKVVAAVRRIMLRHGMEAYDEDAGTGFVRHVVVRVGHESGEVLATIVTNGSEFPGARNFCRELVKACPQVTTVVQNVNTRQTNAILGAEERVLYGPGFILDTLCGLSFRISSHSFYQVNAVQTEVLYRTAIDMATRALPGGSPDAPVRDGAGPAPAAGSGVEGASFVDAYCGTGTIGLVAASLVPGSRVVGVDNVESAIRDARLNARHNGIANARFEADDAGAFLARMAAAGERLDVLLMDPPRAGSSEEFLRAALLLSPRRIVYISCNPRTQERDAQALARGGYRIRAIRPVDMFPHTDHIETVALLTRG